MIQTPVVFIIFNRPEATRKVFDRIAAARPQKLLIIGDGPRISRPAEDLLCNEARSVAKNVDWPCEVLTNFSDSNLGCQERVISGLDWAFQVVEEAIILEDDCVPDETFFVFCQEILRRFRGDSRVGMIAGNNFVAPQHTTEYSYYFSRMPHIWGWATWRSAWRRYDRHLRDWPTARRNRVLEEIFTRQAEVEFWTQTFDAMHDQTGPNTWDIQWLYTILMNNMLSVVPNVNMIRNIGFGAGATHTCDAASPFAKMKESAVSLPLRHPPYVVPLKRFDERDSEVCYLQSTSRKWAGKARRRIRDVQRLLMQASGRPAAKGNC